MGERLLDELARALAQPIPRRRALRLLGTSLATLAVPGFGPRPGRAATTSRSASTCPRDTNLCPWDHDDDFRTPERDYCCGPPAWLWRCGPYTGPGSGRCVNTCTGPGKYVCTSPRRDANGFTKGECCVYPLTDGCNDDGTCRINCAHQHAVQCGETCCVYGQVCKAGKCTRPPCPPDQAPCGRNTCCPTNWRCASPSRRLCKRCARGEDACGPKCCPKGTYCCNDKKGTCCTKKNGSCCGGDSPICCEGTDCCTTKPGGTRCCPKGQTCGAQGTTGGLVKAGAPDVCCPKERVVRLGQSVCCPPGYLSLGGKLVVPMGGGGGLCCEEKRTCGSGSSITCCASNPAFGIDQVCRNGTCVDA